MPIIIDGYNLLRAILKTSGDEFESIDDVGMCLMVGQYLGRTGQKGTIVFDGTGPRDKSAFENIGDLEVLFSGAKLDADTVIENKIATNTAPKRLVVVSSDRRLRLAAKRRKAVAVKAETFWENLVNYLSKKKRASKEPRAKLEGISESETEQWLKAFGFEE